MNTILIEFFHNNNNFVKKSFFHKLVTQDVQFPKQFDQVSYYHCIAAYKALINPFNVGLEEGSRKAEIPNFICGAVIIHCKARIKKSLLSHLKKSSI